MPKVDDGTLDVLLAAKPNLQLVPKNRGGVSQFFGEFKFTVASTPEKVRGLLETSRFDLMILDYNFPAETALLFFEKLRIEGFNLPETVLVSEKTSERLAAEWYRRGGDAYYSREAVEEGDPGGVIRDAVESAMDEGKRQRSIYRDSATGLWGPRQLIRLLDETSKQTGSDFRLGCSIIEVRNTPKDEGQVGVDSERTLLKKLSEPLEEAIAHTGCAGRYWGTMFWALFRNDQVWHFSERLNDLVDAFEGILVKDGIETYAGGVKTMDPASNVETLQEAMDKSLFKARTTRGSNVIIGQL